MVCEKLRKLLIQQNISIFGLPVTSEILVETWQTITFSGSVFDVLSITGILGSHFTLPKNRVPFTGLPHYFGLISRRRGNPALGEYSRKRLLFSHPDLNWDISIITHTNFDTCSYDPPPQKHGKSVMLRIARTWQKSVGTLWPMPWGPYARKIGLYIRGIAPKCPKFHLKTYLLLRKWLKMAINQYGTSLGVN